MHGDDEIGVGPEAYDRTDSKYNTNNKAFDDIKTYRDSKEDACYAKGCDRIATHLCQ